MNATDTTEKTPAQIAETPKAPCAPKAKPAAKKAPVKKAAPKTKGKAKPAAKKAAPKAKKTEAPKVTGTTPKQIAGDLKIDAKVFRQRLRRMVESGTLKLEHSEGKRWGFSAGDVAKIKAAFTAKK